MALIDRIKERCEVDVSDSELQSVIDAVQSELNGRYGDPSQQKVFSGRGAGGILKLSPPADVSQTIIVSETTPANSGDAAAERVLSEDDYRISHGGRVFERLTGGTNSQQYWGDLVTVIYTPIEEVSKRDEVLIKIVILDLEYRGISAERAGDYNVTYGDMMKERKALLASLGDTSGLGMA